MKTKTRGPDPGYLDLDNVRVSVVGM